MKPLIFLLTMIGLMLVGCASSSGIDLSALPQGDATRGEALYTESINGAPTCSSCHALTDVTLVGPGFANYSTIARSRVEGQSARQYTYTAISNPASHIVEGFANVMYAEYRTKLTDQDTADLMAFLLSQ